MAIPSVERKREKRLLIYLKRRLRIDFPCLLLRPSIREHVLQVSEQRVSNQRRNSVTDSRVSEGSKLQKFASEWYQKIVRESKFE